MSYTKQSTFEFTIKNNLIGIIKENYISVMHLEEKSIFATFPFFVLKFNEANLQFSLMDDAGFSTGSFFLTCPTEFHHLKNFSDQADYTF